MKLFKEFILYILIGCVGSSIHTIVQAPQEKIVWILAFVVFGIFLTSLIDYIKEG